ncbi:GNAT family N-acetyltransferase [Cupriavidus taiwanensis]|uniref:GCN5-related N-acetyltransferase n=1 Tax=Cupriavidus taiwanensis TaxID=164546 RepID=A0A375BPP5_9BURK|nr:GNAT family N-acetyltransferase [Cupriavidus taiwanensis]MDK3023354.1 GNAT family N-acetyltransferase [Cupriavidus taiwanensis]NSX14847.1 GNAT family N-acetyltransferase [Cupriavidus taiwanensis]SOY49968.1 putative GCN5-related N-acetyltransferase [Cupriavidus taiwanensis]
MMKDLRIRAAVPTDAPAVGEVLERCGLSVDGVPRLLEHFHVAILGAQIIGCAAGERCGETVVIRSVAVLPEHRDQGVATHVVRAALMRARANGARRAVLLASSCPSYFARYGFTLVPAAKLPPEVMSSSEFLRAADTPPLCMWCELS